MTYFKLLIQRFRTVTEQNHENSLHTRDLNLDLTKRTLGMLTTWYPGRYEKQIDFWYQKLLLYRIRKW
jgi:hypothetical protein